MSQTFVEKLPEFPRNLRLIDTVSRSLSTGVSSTTLPHNFESLHSVLFRIFAFLKARRLFFCFAACGRFWLTLPSRQITFEKLRRFSRCKSRFGLLTSVKVRNDNGSSENSVKVWAVMQRNVAFKCQQKYFCLRRTFKSQSLESVFW